MKCFKCKNELSVFPYNCKFCSNDYCSKHRLPENHNCIGLENWKKGNKKPEQWIYKATKEEFKKEKPKIKSEHIIIVIIVILILLIFLLN